MVDILSMLGWMVLATGSPSTAPEQARPKSVIMRALPGELGQPAPGLYTAEPFTALLLVPGPHPDDAIIRKQNVLDAPEMPIIRPEIRLIPRNSRQR